jgi:hypothetical protein
MTSMLIEYLIAMGPLNDVSEKMTFKRFTWPELSYDLSLPTNHLSQYH